MRAEAMEGKLAREARQRIDKAAATAEFKKVFMTQLRRYRLAAGLNQGDLAKRVGVTTAAVSRWESGIDIPRGSRFHKIARVLGIKPLELTRLIEPETATSTN